MGIAIAGLGLAIFMIVMVGLWVALRKRRTAFRILADLIAAGDRRVWRVWNEDRGAGRHVIEFWRTEVGNDLTRGPFVPGVSEFVLTQHGNRIDDPLERLRTMQANIDNWVA